MWTRRDFLKASLGSYLCAGIPSAFAEAPRSKSGLVGPRYYVVLFLRGGIDGVYTLDPKTRTEVERNVDVPYEASEIVDAGGLQLGPHFKDLKRWANRMAVVRGVQVKTANHESGALQVLRMKTSVSRNMPGLLEVIGLSREQPLAAVTLGRTSSLEHSPAALGGPTGDSKHTVIDALDDIDDEELELLARTYRLHMKRAPRWSSSPESKSTLDHLEQAAALFERLPSVPKFVPEKWSDQGARQNLAKDLQRTLWLLENDLSRGVFVKAFFDWDSHYNNAEKQRGANASFTYILDKFLDALHSRRNEHGTLAEQTCLVFGSELGRFPIINGNLGKDHFPEATYVFMGPNINTNDGKGAAFVPTGKRMEGLKVSLKTGQPDDNGTHLVLDDVGTTMLHMAGMDPAVYGYRGRRLEFLERA